MNMPLSWWEYQDAYHNPELCIVGAGIVGLSTALFYAQQRPKAKIVVLESGNRPSGASLRNAGFACFGSVGEIADDLKHSSLEATIALMAARRRGLALLRKIHGDKALSLDACGGYELFFSEEKEAAEQALDLLPKLNQSLLEAGVFAKEVYRMVKPSDLPQNSFKGLHLAIFHAEEAALNPVHLWQSLLQKCLSLGVRYQPGVALTALPEAEDAKGYRCSCSGFEFRTKRLVMATNAFAHHFLPNQVQPARAQVLVSTPLHLDLPQGTFHHHKGYNYFRFVEGRLLLGGGRHLNPQAEANMEADTSEEIQQYLEAFAQEKLGITGLNIEHRWSGFMGMGKAKMPKIEKDKEGRVWAVRLGGMGVALGTEIGQKAAALCLEDSPHTRDGTS